MQVDKNIFFREATLRICGSLEIEQALWHLFIYIRDYMPSFEAHLHYYDPAGITRTIAMADSSGGKLLNLKTTYPPEVREYINAGMMKEDYIAGDTHKHPALKYVFKDYHKSSLSSLGMFLIAGKNWVGPKSPNI